MKRLTILIASLIAFGYSALAQSELTLPFMTDVFQSTFVNPAIKPEHKVSVGFSGFAKGVNNGLKLEEFVTFPTPNSTVVNKKSLLNSLKDGNMLYADGGFDFHVRFKLQNAFYWFAMREQVSGRLLYPQALLRLPFEGTKSYIGQSVDMSDLNARVMHYTEYMLGMSIELGNWMIGGGLSLLKGIACAEFDPTTLTLQVEEGSWANTVEADALVRCSGLPAHHDNPAKLGFDDVNTKVQYLKRSLWSGNTGFGLRLGVTYKLDDNLKFGFSAYDLGFINWKQDLSYKLHGKLDLKPVDALVELIDADRKFSFDSIKNEIKDAIKFDTVVGGGEKFRTWLDPKFTLSATYKLARRTSVGMLLGATVNKKFYPTVTLGVSQGFGRFFFATANISYAHGTLKNFGAGLVVKPGPVQIFVAVDNYYPFLSNTTLLSFRSTSVRAGLNFVFGRASEPDGLPLR